MIMAYLIYGNSDGKLRGDRDDPDRPDRTLLYPGDHDRSDRPSTNFPSLFPCNRLDCLYAISSDRGDPGDRGDHMETRL